MAVIYGTNAHEKLFGTGDADQISGLDGKDEIFAGGGDDSITGGLGNDVIDGGSGTDTAFYSGNASQYKVIKDWQGNYYVSTGNPGLIFGAPADPNLGEGTDRLINVERLSFNGVVYDIDALVQDSKQYGEATDDYIAAPTHLSTRVLLGLGGNDTLVGRTDLQDYLYGGDGNDSLVGNGSGPISYSIGDVLDGGTGADYMEGGEGLTYYHVDNAGDVVVETGSPPVGNIHNKLSDIIYATVSYDAVANVEVLDFLGTANVNSTGNTEANTIKGNSGNNAINGAGGNDTLRGRDGDDTVTGGDDNDHIEGNDGNDWIEGGAGNDALYAGAGIDTLVGGMGDDAYFDVGAEDTITELAGGGIDTVNIDSSYDLQEYIENANVNGSSRGNAMNNVISDVSGAGTLWGMGGNDTLSGDGSLYGGEGHDKLIGGAYMEGGVGKDVYVVRNTTSVVYEAAGEGRDQVRSYINYTLGDNVEDLKLLDSDGYGGGGHINGTGNAMRNEIFGNESNNRLSGLDGDDWLIGYGGNDTLEGGAGRDALHGWGGNDSLVGGDDIDGMSGGDGIDTLIGGDGGDVFSGDAGNDVLTGGAGADLFYFSAAATNGRDQITDFEHGVDHLVFSPYQYNPAALFTLGTAAVGTSAQFLWDPATGSLAYDANGTGAGQRFELAQIVGATVTQDDLYFV